MTKGTVTTRSQKRVRLQTFLNNANNILVCGLYVFVCIEERRLIWLRKRKLQCQVPQTSRFPTEFKGLLGGVVEFELPLSFPLFLANPVTWLITITFFTKSRNTIPLIRPLFGGSVIFSFFPQFSSLSIGETLWEAEWRNRGECSVSWKRWKKAL